MKPIPIHQVPSIAQTCEGELNRQQYTAEGRMRAIANYVRGRGERKADAVVKAVIVSPQLMIHLADILDEAANRLEVDGG